MKNMLNNNAAIADKERHELMIFPLSLLCGTYFRTATLNPSKASDASNSREDNNVDPSPTCSTENSLAFIVQKKKPNSVNMMELAINQTELLYR